MRIADALLLYFTNNPLLKEAIQSDGVSLIDDILGSRSF